MCCACREGTSEGTLADRSENAPTPGFLSLRPTLVRAENRPRPKRRFAFGEDTVSLGRTSDGEDGHNYRVSLASTEGS